MANSSNKGLAAEVHECNSGGSCQAHMYMQGNILRCNLCGHTTTITAWQSWKLSTSEWHPPKLLPFIPMELGAGSVYRELVTA